MTEQERMQLQALRIQLVAAVAQIDVMMVTVGGPHAAGGEDDDPSSQFYQVDEPVGSATHS